MDGKYGVDSRIVETNQIVTIYQTLANPATFNVLINNISFIPDVMIVKTLSYFNNGAEGKVSGIYTNLVNSFIGPLIDGRISDHPNLEFIIQKPIRGQYNFQILTVAGLIDTTRTGNLFIQLDFVKYKNIKQDTIY